MISPPRLTATARALPRAAARVLEGLATGLRTYRAAHSRSARRLVAAGIGLAIAAAFLPAVLGGTASASEAVASGTDETTVSQDNLRTGWDPHEPTLTPGNISGQTPGYQFGQVFKTAVTGQVYAQPLVVGSTVIVATEEDYVYGLNAATGAVKWTTRLGTPYTMTSCTALHPYIGVTGSPVYDPATGDIYVVAQVLLSSGRTYVMFGINASTGAIDLRRPITGAASNDPHITFSATNELERPGLLLMNGSVYAAFGSYCDDDPYVGFVDGVKISSGALTQWSDETGVTDNQAGIWQSGGGVMSDGSGRIFVTSGNGISPAAGPGNEPPGQLAESVIRLSVLTGGALAAKDFFSPANAPALDAGDVDFGSGGPVGLPFGTSKYPHVLAQAGKDGRIFLLNRDNLGGREQAAGQGDKALSVTVPYHGLWGHPAVFGDTTALTTSNAGAAHDYLYYIGTDDILRVLKFGVTALGHPTLSEVAYSSLVFGETSGSPTVTSTGRNSTTAVVWAVHSPDVTGASSALEAFAAGPGSGCHRLGTVHDHADMVGTDRYLQQVHERGHLRRDGLRGLQGRLRIRLRRHSPGGAGSHGAGPHLPGACRLCQPSQGRRRHRDLERHRDRGQRRHHGHQRHCLEEPVPHGQGHADPRGQQLKDQGLVPGQAAQRRHADGPGDVQPDGSRRNNWIGVVHHPVRRLALGDRAPDGHRHHQRPVRELRSGAFRPGHRQWGVRQQRSRGARAAPGGRYRQRQHPSRDHHLGRRRPLRTGSAGCPLPAPYSGLASRSSSRSSSRRPAPGRFPGGLSVTGSNTATVNLSGTGLPARGLFTATPTSVNFGTVRVGHKVTKSLTVTNTGNEPATVTTATTLNAPFADRPNVTPGLPVNAGYDVKIPVTFTPTKKGNFTSTYRLTWTDVTGAHIISVQITGHAV